MYNSQPAAPGGATWPPRGQIGDNCHIWQLCPGHQVHRTRPRKVTLLLNPNTSTMAEELT